MRLSENQFQMWTRAMKSVGMVIISENSSPFHPFIQCDFRGNHISVYKYENYYEVLAQDQKEVDDTWQEYLAIIQEELRENDKTSERE